ncbi:hypothetical protein SK128_020902, partial [Halocaridina rubra]
MVSSVCRGSYPSMIPHASPSRKPHVDPQKDYTVPLQVETSVEYDLPAHIYPPKDSEPILMIHPGYLSAARARSRAVVTPSPTAMVATSGAARPLAPLQLPQQHPYLVPGSTLSSVRSSSTTTTSRNNIAVNHHHHHHHPRSWCACGNPNCSNTSSVKSVNNNNTNHNNNNTNDNHHTVQNLVQSGSARSVQSNSTQSRSVQNSSLKSVQNIMGISATRNGSSSGAVLLQPQQQQPQMLWGGGGTGGRCAGPCCNPRAGAMAPIQAEFVAPGLPPSLLARTPTRGTAGGSPKLRAARTRRGLSVASSVNLPDYLGNTRVARATGAGAVHAHPRPRALSTSMGALVATPAPPMAHQQHTGMGASLTLTPRSLIPVQQQQQQAVSASTASLLYTVGLSRDSGCSVGAETAGGGEWAASDRTRGLVDSGFCTPVDLTDDFVA